MSETLTIGQIQTKLSQIETTAELVSSIEQFTTIDTSPLAEELAAYFSQLWSELTAELYGEQDGKIIQKKLLHLHFLFHIGAASPDTILDLSKKLALRNELQLHLLHLLNKPEIQPLEDSFTHLLASILIAI